MPKVHNGPKALNTLLERVYDNCMKEKDNATVCSMTAWQAAKNAGWKKSDDGKWVKKTMEKSLFKEVLNGES